MTEIVPGVYLEKLLDAIKHVETSGGRNCWPNVEPSWIPKGAQFTVEGKLVTGTGTNMSESAMTRWVRFESSPEGPLQTSASWGPWQILYHTAADRGYAGPPFLLMGENVSREWVVKQLEHLARRGCKTVRDFADAWNSGNHKDANVVKDYTDKIEAAYAG